MVVKELLLEIIWQLILRRTGLATDGFEEAQLMTGNVTLPRLHSHLGIITTVTLSRTTQAAAT